MAIIAPIIKSMCYNLLMTPQAIYLLNVIRSLKPEDERIEFSNSRVSLQNDQREYREIKWFKSGIYASLNELSDNGYIEFRQDKSFTLTSKGLRRNWFTVESIISFLFRSILVPIAVSILTSAICIHLWSK